MALLAALLLGIALGSTVPATACLAAAHFVGISLKSCRWDAVQWLAIIGGGVGAFFGIFISFLLWLSG